MQGVYYISLVPSSMRNEFEGTHLLDAGKVSQIDVCIDRVI
jgi:hypothetical protein